MSFTDVFMRVAVGLGGASLTTFAGTQTGEAVLEAFRDASSNDTGNAVFAIGVAALFLSGTLLFGGATYHVVRHGVPGFQ